MKILLIAPACDGDDVGESWVAFQWAKNLAERVDLTVLTTYKRGHRPPSVQLPGVKVVEWEEPAGVGRFERLNSLMQPGYLPFYFRARRWIKRRLAENYRFDVAHQIVPVAMRYPSPAAGLGIPFIIGPVGGSLTSPAAFEAEEGATPWYQRLRAVDQWRMAHDRPLRRTYESADCVVGVAPYVAEFLAGVNLKRFETLSETAVQGVEDPIDRSGRSGPVQLLHVGRAVRTKGLRDTIRALALLQDTEAELDVVGDGNDRAACEALAAELGVIDRIRFHGSVPRAMVDTYYAAADIFVFPSYREPGGNVSLEAMSFGLPVIVCRRGGPGANVDDSCSIRLDAVSPDQLARDCAAAARRLIENSDLRLRMGEAGRAHVLRTHLWSSRISSMMRLYEECLADHGRRPSDPT